MFEQLFCQTPEYRRLCEGLAQKGTTALFGLPPLGRAQVLAALSRASKRPLCVVTAGEAEASRFAADLNALGLRTGVFPSRDLVLRPIEGAGREYEYRRLAVLGDLAGDRLQAVCLSAEAWLSYTVPPREFRDNTLMLAPGTEIERTELLLRLTNAGYHRRDRVEGPGQFSARGDIVDIYAPEMAQPARVEFWGDEIDTIHSFDLLTQRRDEALSKVFISPAREVLFGDSAQAARALREFQSLVTGKKRQAMETAMQTELAALDSGSIPEAMDKYYSIRYARPALLMDHMQDPILVMEEPAAIREADRATQFRRSEQIKTLLEQGILCAELADLWPDETRLLNAMAIKSSLACENYARTMPDIALKQIVSLTGFSLPGWAGDLASLLEELEHLPEGHAVTIMAGTAKAAEALSRDLCDRGYRANTARDAVPAPGIINVLPGQLTGGCSYPSIRYTVITGRRHDIDGKNSRKAVRRSPNALSSLSDIKPGDYVVHQNYGIGLYVGIEQMKVDGIVQDYLRINYDKTDVLYVPVTQLDALSRYSSPGEEPGRTIRLNRLSGSEWSRTRSRVAAATEEMAQELIQLYARRSQAKGFAFPEDDDWQRNFETRFDYDETDDQLRSSYEIKKDMEKPTPMDRLLCGDVGVGKTEVALRAAFKCVMGGKQCAILAPTTLLAWQHYNTLLTRMEAFPVHIELMSRFRTARAMRETTRMLQAGEVDIVVGTHRLLSKDVQFKNLGLVIIDEEQRFGVKHKEHLKEAFVGVDMLTLSATPIPRTLNMAINGIRDISTIEQPPYERQPIETYVLEYDWGILAEAIKKELARGGQVYYLHNYVNSIYRCAEKVSEMVPGARVGVAHGQMTETELSKVWKQLLENEIDVLVCTTLIETGVDVRNCNTLIVEDADRLGLSQLYQIRGRVGRSGRKAYAYFTFHRNKVLTDVAEKRLDAIREFTSFGSGFRIAMRDLQIRGAGNLLGRSQHGHMDSVGYDLYVKMLGQAVAKAKGEAPAPDKSDCRVHVNLDAYIPDAYIPDSSGRIEAYRRIAAIQNEEDAADVLDELIDRYGEPPACVSNLVQISLIRVLATAAGIVDIRHNGDTLKLSSAQMTAKQVRPILNALPGKARIDPRAAGFLSIRVEKGDSPLELLRTALLAAAQEAAGAAPPPAEM